MDKRFKNRAEALKYLQESGFRIKKSKFYSDIQKGFIVTNKDGTFDIDVINNYSKTLKSNNKDVSDLQEKKLKKEIERLTQQVEKLQFENEKERGKYILRSEFEREIGSRIAAFDINLRNMFYVYASSWVDILQGNDKNISFFLEDLNLKLDIALDEISKTNFDIQFNGG